MSQVFKFILSGSFIALAQLTLFYLLNEKVLFPYLTASTLAFIAAFFVNFFLQKFWAFQDASVRIISQISLFFANSLLNLLWNTLLMLFFVEMLSFPPFLAQILTMGVLMTYNFFMYRKIFRV